MKEMSEQKTQLGKHWVPKVWNQSLCKLSVKNYHNNTCWFIQNSRGEPVPCHSIAVKMQKGVKVVWCSKFHQKFVGILH